MLTLSRRFWFVFTFLILVACRPGEAQPTSTSTLVATALPAATVTAPPTAVPTAVAMPTTVTATATATAVPAGVVELALPADGIILQPGPALYAGDHVTFQIRAAVPPDIPLSQVRADILVDGRRLASGTMGARDFSGQALVLFEWAWDTTGAAGPHELQIILDPDDVIQAGDVDQADNSRTLTVLVQPDAARPASEQGARWVTVEREAARLHVISGSAAERDLDQLIVAVDTAVRLAADRLNVRPVQKIDFYFSERVMGQGGYANSVIVISYLDRDYSGSGLQEVVMHEAVHMLERQFAPERLPFLSEGIAVWATGGHYQQEDLLERNAALLALDQYVPLAELVDTFYLQQHEVAYLEAAGFVSFLVERFGWARVRTFYGGLRLERGESPAQGLDRQLRTHFGLSLDQLESAWLATLLAQPPSVTAQSDLQTTIRYYDLMRRYQQTYDPTAYFLDAWLPFPDEAAARGLGLPADFMRHPRTEINVVLETMLVAAEAAWRVDDDLQANVLLDSVERVLNRGGLVIDPLAGAYQQLVQLAAEMGYEAQQISVNLPQASVLVRRVDDRQLFSLKFTRQGQEWMSVG